MIIPRPHSVVIKPIDDPDVSPGGIIIPDMAKERTDQGIVKYVGESVTFVRPGDWILFSGYAGTLIFLEGEGRLISMDEKLVLAICGPQDWAITKVAGLYYMSKDGDMIPATYETAVDLLIDCNQKWYSGIRPSKKGRKIDSRPDTESLEVAINWTDHLERDKE